MRRIAWIAVLVALTACSKAAAPASSGNEGGGNGGPSATAASPAVTSPPAAASSASTTVPASSGGIKYYECSSLLSDSEVQQATGISDAALSNQEKGQGIKGQTYCQFFAEQGAVSIAVSVLTGPAFDQVYKPLETAASQAQVESISGLGDWAGWSAAMDMLGARVGSIGVTIIFSNIGGGSLGISDPQGAATAIAKLIVSRL